MISLRKLLRYAAVSGVATTISQIVLATLVATRATGAVTANVIATMVGTVPSFELNRRWVWGKRGRRSLSAEVVPFAIISAAGLALSSLAVAIASHAVDGFATTSRTLIIQLSSLTAFGIVWLVQFVMLDRVLFRHRVGPTRDATDEMDEMDELDELDELVSAAAGQTQAVADTADGLDQRRLLDVDLVA